nr:MAG TPA: hypothetical protein [Caudoviricetes sp.]
MTTENQHSAPVCAGAHNGMFWDWMNAQADARPMYKQRSWQAVTSLRLKTESLVVRALQPVSRRSAPAIQSPKHFNQLPRG